eukprot:1161844-Pelagomonas_calceolata.AAC.11
MDIGSGGRLAQHNLQIPTDALNRAIPPYLFPQNFPKSHHGGLDTHQAVLMLYWLLPIIYIPHCYPGKHWAVHESGMHLFMLQLSCPRRQQPINQILGL